MQHNLRDPNRDHTHGRIWRVHYTKQPLVTPPKIAGEPVAALLDPLKSVPEERTRYRVRTRTPRPTDRGSHGRSEEVDQQPRPKKTSKTSINSSKPSGSTSSTTW